MARISTFTLPTLARDGAVLVALVLCLLLVPHAAAQKVCKTQAMGNDEFRGVSGSSDTNVIAVGKKGNITRYDGNAWSPMVSPTGEDLRDVEVFSATEAFAVGKKGTILQLSGGVWTAHVGVTNEELQGVWAASDSAVWVVGKKGELHYYDGVSWSDQSVAAGVSNKDLEDVWGDAASVYALNGEGTLYRYDRGTASWDAPDTQCEIGDKFEDLWGDAAGNLYLVGKDEVYLHNGSSCTLIAAASEDLRGVSGSLVTGEIYAVGKKGAVLYFDGLSWQETEEATEDFFDDWVSSSGSAYYAGKKGELTVCEYAIPSVIGDWLLDDCTLDSPGSPVLDSGINGLDGITSSGVSLQTDGRLCPAVGLDGSSAVVTVADAPPLSPSASMSFAVWVRHNAGATGNWETVFAKGDSAYRLHLNGGCEIADFLPGNTTHGITFGLNGGCGGANLNSNVVPAAGTWYHVAGSYDGTTMRIYIDGALVNKATYNAPIGNNAFDFAIGDNLANVGRHWDGDIDELTLWDSGVSAQTVLDHMNRTRACIVCGSPEFVISHDTYGIHCTAETIQIDVVDSLAGTPRTNYNSGITLNTQSGAGNWTLISGGGSFNDATADDGMATYNWPLSESTAVFALSYRSGAAALNIDAYETLNPAIRDQDGEGVLVFSASGFTLTGGALSNPPPGTIAPFAGPRVAGTDMPLYLTAFGQTPSDPQCGVIESYTGPRDIKFWSDYLDPASGTIAVTVDNAAVATSEGAAAVHSVAFVNGQAQVSARYKDVGRIRLSVKDDTLAHPDLPNGIRGATPNFVVMPDHFELSDIEDGAGNANPAAAGPGGAVFLAAGQPFSLRVTSVDAQGDPTPNYGRESSAESVTLTTTLVAPAAGNNPALTPAAGFGGFVSGSATGSSFVWPEVGIITLTPSVADGSYLTAGNVSGQPSVNVGRFIPDHFDVTLNTPALTTSCAGGGFTYVGESFGYSLTPRITATARSALGTATQNYNGAFFKLDNASVVNRDYTAAAGTLNLAGLPATTVDPLIADTGGGTATLTFGAGTGLAFDRGAPLAQFDADIRLSVDVLDADAVAATTNPVIFGAAGGMSFDAGARMQYGRAIVTNAVGSELVDLALPFATQTYVDAATGFVANINDSCSAAPVLSLGSYAGNLGGGETCVHDSGNPGSSGAGCAAPGPAASRFRSPPLAGDFNLYLAAPGSGNDGSVTVTGDVPAWLEFDWDTAAPGNEDPQGTATFGIYAGNARRIYTREVY